MRAAEPSNAQANSITQSPSPTRNTSLTCTVMAGGLQAGRLIQRRLVIVHELRRRYRTLCGKPTSLDARAMRKSYASVD
jgi:hypothetical protein